MAPVGCSRRRSDPSSSSPDHCGSPLGIQGRRRRSAHVATTSSPRTAGGERSVARPPSSRRGGACPCHDVVRRCRLSRRSEPRGSHCPRRQAHTPVGHDQCVPNRAARSTATPMGGSLMVREPPITPSGRQDVNLRPPPVRSAGRADLRKQRIRRLRWRAVRRAAGTSRPTWRDGVLPICSSPISNSIPRRPRRRGSRHDRRRPSAADLRILAER